MVKTSSHNRSFEIFRKYRERFKKVFGRSREVFGNLFCKIILNLENLHYSYDIIGENVNNQYHPSLYIEKKSHQGPVKCE